MKTLLEQINSPDDLKKLSVGELKQLAVEIREFILSSVSKTGGHLASSLGVVELTIALHYVFDFAKDSLLWDVGHQCYVHKILTGRKDKFSKIRQREGLSGFPLPSESEYDAFEVGHAGTSIPTAIGVALGEQSQNKQNKIAAIVGDASIVNGMSFEGLNNLGLVKRQMLIILNDNSMAIDATEGALAKYFSKVRLSQSYEGMRKTTNNILEHLPVIGKGLEDTIEKIKKTIRMAMPASQMFESMDIPYFGPVDGHDTASLIQLFTGLSRVEHPVILHVYTKKGKGFVPAEENKPKYHSTGPFVINGDTAEHPSKKGNKSYTEVFGEQLVRLGEKDKRIVAITAAMCDGTGLGEFSKKFPERFYDLGIAESAAVDIAAGMSKTGLKPVVCIYSTFLQRGFDQIFQEVSLQDLPVVFCIDRAGLVGSDGPTHHGLMDIGYLRILPNLVLCAPANEYEMGASLEYALNSSKSVCVRYPREVVPGDDYDMSACNTKFETGKSVVVRENKSSQAVIVSYGSMLSESLRAAEALEGDGVQVDVINARFAEPIDERIVELAESGKAIVTVEDHFAACGFGSNVAEKIIARYSKNDKSESDIRSRIRVLGVPGRHIMRGSRREQFMDAGISADNIKDAINEMIESMSKIGD